MAPCSLGKRWLKRFDVLAYSSEYNWVSVSEMQQELHLQGVDVTRWLIVDVLRASGWKAYPTNSNKVIWINPERHLNAQDIIRRE